MESSYGFRLQEINHNTEICSNKDLCDDTATSLSSYSNYKHRIDAMFDDSRSVLSDVSRSDTRRKSLIKCPDTRNEMCKERVIANNIQEKIEKMFEDVSVNDSEGCNPGVSETCRKEGFKSCSSAVENTLRNDFVVTYLGSKPLQDKNITLMGLQDPLKELYFEYKRNPFNEDVNVLTISPEGLKIKISDKEELNPFPSIAVWASVKLAFRVTSSTTEYAFLPLITDPGGIDKNSLFKELKEEDKYIIPRNFQEKIDDDNQSPIFTVVMKNINVNKQLECHGFICKSSEDAIVIAANLYQALMKKLKRKKELKEHKNKQSNTNDVIFETSESEGNRIKPKVKVKKQAPPIPVRSSTPKGERDPSLVLRSEAFNHLNDFQSESNQKVNNPEKKESGEVSQRRRSVPDKIFQTEVESSRFLRRTVSDRGGNGITIKDQCDGGDILTKVAIPRSQSFLNANGPLSRFSRRQKTNSKNEILSPLGFKELFNEFRIHEGLESMDDILSVIIDAEGMSFNDLKPIYKEFLLKLAVTLTKDELYQRSKIIMRRQKKRNRNCNFRKKPFIYTMGINKIFRKTASRLGKTKNSKSANLEFTSIVFQSNNKQFESNLPNNHKSNSKSFRVKRKKSSKRKSSKRPGRIKIKNISTTSEDSDFFQPKRNTNDSVRGPNRSSSGYFSCSECSYNSENCTCTSADKCYCTLSQKKCCSASSSDVSRIFRKNKTNCHSAHKLTIEQHLEDSLKSCSCDTESCADSGKCYCTINESKNLSGKIIHLSDVDDVGQTGDLAQEEKLDRITCPIYIKAGCKKHRKFITDQVKEKGFIVAESTLSRSASPTAAWQTNEKITRNKRCLNPSGSLKFLRVQTSESRKNLKESLLPPYCYPSIQNHLLKEIQNTTYTELDTQNFENEIRNNYHPEYELEKSMRKRHLHSTPSYPCGRRQYSSMRCRNESLSDLTNSEGIHRSVSYRTKHFFSSVRSNHSCDNIMNHIKFPNAGYANTSLRFTRRMDVYNSFSKDRCINRQDNFVFHSSFKENKRKEIGHVFASQNDCRYNFNGSKENLQKLDYTLLKTQNFEKFHSVSHASRKKVLVVSARDPRGNVLYMGANTKCENDVRNSMNYVDNTEMNATEALAVKKSAEIAALFSELPHKQNVKHLDYVRDQKQNNYRSRSISYKTTNLENGLGYLP